MSRYAKAIVGALIAALTAIGAAIQDISPGGSHITSEEWLTAIIGGLTALGVVWAVPNRP